MNKDIDKLQELRKKVFITGYKGGMAHLASCFSCLEILYVLYNRKVLNIKKDNPKWENRDRFILSKGHAGLALYSVLENNELIDNKYLDSYLVNEHLIGGEPCTTDCEWIEASTGSLGHGLSMGLGMAIGLKDTASKVYVLLGDGECQEGSVWEAAMMAAAQNCNNLIAILDCNRIQKMDFTNRILGNENWKEKWESFGWLVKEVDGHSVDKLESMLKEKNDTNKPLLIIANTIKGKGVSIMENNPNWHFKLPNKKELEVFKKELNIQDSELI